jgi:hypothetical protein
MNDELTAEIIEAIMIAIVSTGTVLIVLLFVGLVRRTKRCPLYPNSDRESGIPAKGHVCFTHENGHVPARAARSP